MLVHQCSSSMQECPGCCTIVIPNDKGHKKKEVERTCHTQLHACMTKKKTKQIMLKSTENKY